MVIWLIGKSGSGKTFFAKKIYKIFKKKIKTIWIDGDKFRAVYSNDLGYSIKDRKENSKRIQNHCLKYELKNYLVICSILSIFKSHQKKNKVIFRNYFQVFIDAKQDRLEKRNNKMIYTKNKSVVGRHIKFPIPYKSNLKIENNFRFYKKNLKLIIKKLNEKLSKDN